MVVNKSNSVSVALLKHLKNYGEKYGINFSEIAGVDWSELTALRDGRKRISGKQFERIWRQIVSVTPDPHPGLNLGREIAGNFPGGNLLFTMMVNCATIGGALDTFVRYHRIMADIIQPRVQRDGNVTYLSWQSSQGTLPPHPDLSEALLYIYYCIFGHLSEGKLHPVEVRFSHVEPDDLSVYRQLFKSQIIFGAQRNELVVASGALEIEINLANQELFEILENYAARIASLIGAEHVWSNRVVTLTSEMLIKGIKPEIDTVAKKLAVSRRSLQAKLKDEATTYRNCLATVRKQIALDYLAKPDTTLADVAFLLGYSEQSAFNHAFKRWTGKSPKEYCTTSK